MALSATAQELTLCPAVQPCAASRPVTIGATTRLSLVWRGQGWIDRGGDVVSERGFFTLDTRNPEEPLAVVSQPLVERVIGSSNGIQVSFSFREQLTVPADVSRRAAASGARQLFYVRRFRVNGMAATGVQRISLSAPLPNTAASVPEGQTVSASGLILQRLALRFDTGKTTASVARGAPLRALASVRYERAGLLQAVWELATPASTRGQPVFRPLQPVRQYLGGARTDTLRSPLLPTAEPGLYLLRLRLLQPALEQDSIELRYRVSGEAAAPAYVPELRVQQPGPGRALGVATEFRWQAVPGTRAYQLEIYDRPPAPASTTAGSRGVRAEMTTAPSTGLLVRGGSNHTRLSPTVLQRLLPGRIYYWRIVAVNAQGSVVAASQVQSIRSEQ